VQHFINAKNVPDGLNKLQ